MQSCKHVKSKRIKKYAIQRPNIRELEWSFPGGSMRETRVRSLGRQDSPGEGNGNPLQYSCLENPKDRGAWWATDHGLQRVGHD